MFTLHSKSFRVLVAANQRALSVVDTKSGNMIYASAQMLPKAAATLCFVLNNWK